MLKLKNILKHYVMGNTVVEALKGVNIEFRKSEFVSILGPSGCGKTTLLNIIGGLDRYTDGDLVINGVSTKLYKSGDWDTYRNHKVGFVFQNYNLIPHQTVLANVELALTLTGVSKSERRRRAKEVLEKVGLGDQLKKKPTQMSGGQMQRVAIARALVNDPDIILADEPTGALDTETSVQIMELLKEVSKDKLIVMVTHNPELAENYSSRIIRLVDGNVVDDSNPFVSEEEDIKDRKKIKKDKKPSMKLHTALSLSLNNLMTKKARTFLTAFAGSIGIIGIALILSVSNGVQAFIDIEQEKALSSFPITITAEDRDLGSIMSTFSNSVNSERDHELDAVYSNDVMYDLFNELISVDVKTNNLKAFKKYLEDKNIVSNDYISAIQYGYGFTPAVYVKDKDGSIIKSDVMEFISELMEKMGMGSGTMTTMTMGSSFNVWQEMLHGEGSETVNPLFKEQYELIYGNWPQSANEIVLMVDKNNEISDMVLYSLGLMTSQEMMEIMQAAQKGQPLEVEQTKITFSELLSMNFKVVLPGNYYKYDESTKIYTDLRDTESGLRYLYDNGFDIKISGIIRSNSDSAMMTGSIGYTKELTEYIIKQSNNAAVVKEQLSNTEKNVVNGLFFKPENMVEPTDDEKAKEFINFVSTLNTIKKAELYTNIISTPDQEYVEQLLEQYLSADRATLEQMIIGSYAEETGMSEQELKEYISGLDDERFYETVKEGMTERIKKEYEQQVKKGIASKTPEQLASALDAIVEINDKVSEEIKQEQIKTLAYYRDDFMDSFYSETDYKETLKLLGYIDIEEPSLVNIYSSTFDNKDLVALMIEEYNKGVAEDDKITYTDYVKIILSSITAIIDAIAYVLIAFVAISLVVSSIMIGIITYISVLERTKEIGILRSIGASKKDISRVFNAETLIVGLAAGIIGIGSTVLLCIPINAIIQHLTQMDNIRAYLPPVAGVVLVFISVILTVIAGLFPARIASKKDPVEALRSE